MGSFPLLKATGLQTAHNPFSATADGFLQVAKNVVISANHVVEPRRGHRNFPNTYTLANSAVGAFFGDTLLAGTSAALFRDTGTAFASVGAFTPVDDLLLRMKFVEARQNLYFNADDGVRVIRETVETAPVMAGLPTPVISHSALAYPGSTVGLLAPNNQVAIRIVYGYVDGNGNEILSAPSERLVFKRPADIVVPTGNVARASNVVTVTFPDHGFEAYDIADNTDGSLAFSPPEDVVTVVSTSVFTYPQTAGNFVSTVPETFSVGRKDILVRGDLPSELTTDHFVRFYRTEFSGAASAAPGDEMFLVYERQLSETDISNGYFETVLGTSNSGAVLSAQPLYTNARNGEGVLQLNDRPPVAKDIAVFGGRTWYANTTSKHRATVELLGTSVVDPSADGFQPGDTITVANQDFTAITPVDGDGYYRFDLETVYAPSRNVARTTQALRNAVNGTSTTVRAYCISGDNDAPGKILFEAIDYGGDAFTVYSSRSTAWNPELGSDPGTGITSDNNRLPHGLFYSKPDQPEAVPLVNYLLVGSKNHEIVRIIPLREKLYVFKTDGIFTVSGEAPFTVDQLDAKTKLICPDSAQVLNNQILCLTNQGVVSVSDAGVQLLSRSIEDQLLPYLNEADRARIQRHAFGLAHETDRTYELWVPTSPSNPNACSLAFVYNTITNAWTTWETEGAGSRTWGVVSPTDVRQYGGYDCYGTGTAFYERRDFASTDYAEEAYVITPLLFATYDVDNDYQGDDDPNGVEPYNALIFDVGFSAAAGDLFEYTYNGYRMTSTVVNGEFADQGILIISPGIPRDAFNVSGAVTIHKPIESEIQWAPVSLDRPGTDKRFSYGTIHFGRPTAFTTGYVTYETELSFGTTREPITSQIGFGVLEWGTAAWGDPAKSISIRHTIPAEKQRGAMLYPGFTIRETFAGWKLHGISLNLNEVSESTGR